LQLRSLQKRLTFVPSLAKGHSFVKTSSCNTERGEAFF